MRPDHDKVPPIIGHWTGMRAGEIVMLRWEQIRAPNHGKTTNSVRVNRRRTRN